MGETYTGLTLAQILRQIFYEIGQVTGGSISYNKFPRWLAIEKLNDRQAKFVHKSQCIRKLALLQCKAGYTDYKLPENCMDGGVIGMPKYYQSTTSYQNLYIRDTQWLDEHYQGWLTDRPSQPLHCYFPNSSFGNIPVLGVYPAPAVDGTSYLLSPDTGIAIGGDLPGTSTNIAGRATGGSATELDDASGVDFTTMGLASGMAILNVSDGSSCNIISITAAAITTSALSGGAANTWNAGDSYNILAGEYGVITSWTGDDTYLFSSDVGKITNITVPAGNIRVDYVPYPSAFPEAGGDDLYPDIPRLYHQDLAMGVVADFLSTFNEKTKEFARAQAYEQKFWAGVERATIGKKTRPFADKPVQIMPKRKGFRNK